MGILTSIWGLITTPHPETDVSRADDLPGDVQKESQKAFDEAVAEDARDEIH